MSDRFLRTEALIGKENTDKLKNCRIAVFGIGGVGSYAAESLARSGVGHLSLYDNDTLCVSNINRQLIALDSTVGEEKVSVAKQRYTDINPDIIIDEHCEFITPDSNIPFSEYDSIIDAVDNVTAKLFLAENAQRNNVPIISVMGTGNKLYPEMLQISDIYDTRECPLCRVMRTELKKRSINGLTVVWSCEHPIESKTETDLKTTGRQSPASMAFVPGCAGLIAAAYVIRKLTNNT